MSFGDDGGEERRQRTSGLALPTRQCYCRVLSAATVPDGVAWKLRDCARAGSAVGWLLRSAMSRLVLRFALCKLPRRPSIATPADLSCLCLRRVRFSAEHLLGEIEDNTHLALGPTGFVPRRAALRRRTSARSKRLLNYSRGPLPTAPPPHAYLGPRCQLALFREHLLGEVGDNARLALGPTGFVPRRAALRRSTKTRFSGAATAGRAPHSRPPPTRCRCFEEAERFCSNGVPSALAAPLPIGRLVF